MKHKTDKLNHFWERNTGIKVTNWGTIKRNEHHGDVSGVLDSKSQIRETPYWKNMGVKDQLRP